MFNSILDPLHEEIQTNHPDLTFKPGEFTAIEIYYHQHHIGGIYLNESTLTIHDFEWVNNDIGLTHSCVFDASHNYNEEMVNIYDIDLNHPNSLTSIHEAIIKIKFEFVKIQLHLIEADRICQKENNHS